LGELETSILPAPPEGTATDPVLVTADAAGATLGLAANAEAPFSSCEGVEVVLEDEDAAADTMVDEDDAPEEVEVEVEEVEVEVVEEVAEVVEAVEGAAWLVEAAVGESSSIASFPDVAAEVEGDTVLSERPSRSDMLSLRARKAGITNFGIGMVEHPHVEFAA